MFWFTLITLISFIFLLLVDIIDSVNLLYIFTIFLFISFSILNSFNLSYLLSNSFHPIIILLFSLSIINSLTNKSNLSPYIYTLLTKCKSKYLFIISTLFLTFLFSSIINNSLVISTFIPIIKQVSDNNKWDSKNLLISTSFISILGGTLTLLGSSTNLLAASILKPELNLEIFSLFKYSFISLIFGFLYLFLYNILNISNSYLPCFFKKNPELNLSITFLFIKETSNLIGKNIKKNNIQEIDGYQLSAIKKYHTLSYVLPRSQNILDAGDLLVYLGLKTGSINKDFLTEHSLELNYENDSNLLLKPNLAIGTINRFSYLKGKCIKDINFKKDYHLILLGIIRNNKYMTIDIKNLIIKTNDRIIVSGLNGKYEMIMEISNLCTKTNIISFPKILKNTNIIYYDISVLVFFIVMIITGFLKIDSTLVSIICIYLYYLVGILNRNDIILSFNNNRTIILGTFSSLLFSNCLVKSGLIDTLSSNLENFKNINQLLLYFFIHFFSGFISIFLNNSAVIAIFIPIIKMVFTNDLFKVSLLVIHGSSCCFSSPTGYHTNLMVYNEGGYSCKDFLVIGFPIQILTSIIFTLSIYYL